MTSNSAWSEMGGHDNASGCGRPSRGMSGYLTSSPSPFYRNGNDFTLTITSVDIRRIITLSAVSSQAFRCSTFDNPCKPRNGDPS